MPDMPFELTCAQGHNLRGLAELRRAWVCLKRYVRIPALKEVRKLEDRMASQVKDIPDHQESSGQTVHHAPPDKILQKWYGNGRMRENMVDYPTASETIEDFSDSKVFHEVVDQPCAKFKDNPYFCAWVGKPVIFWP